MNRALLAVALVAACGDKQAPATGAPSVPETSVVVAPVPAEAQPARQLVTALVDDWTSTHATLRLWTRTGPAPWQAVGEPWPAVIGRAGSGWGTGLHAEPPSPGPRKKEGDEKSPAGMFAFRGSYGYADNPPDEARLAYSPSAGLECVDDPASTHYASIVDRRQVAADWQSSEQMRRHDGLYTWVLDVAHNPKRKPGGGSCIFLHVWGGPQTTTEGCTAMDASRLVDLVKQLDPAKSPTYVLLPRAEYEALAAAWDLPR